VAGWSILSLALGHAQEKRSAQPVTRAVPEV